MPKFVSFPSQVEKACVSPGGGGIFENPPFQIWDIWSARDFLLFKRKGKAKSGWRMGRWIMSVLVGVEWVSGDGQEETVQALLNYSAFFKEVTVLQYAAGVGSRHERALAPFAGWGKRELPLGLCPQENLVFTCFPAPLTAWRREFWGGWERG